MLKPCRYRLARIPWFSRRVMLALKAFGRWRATG